MEIDELIQLIRVCSLANVRISLEKLKKDDSKSYYAVVGMFKEAAVKPNSYGTAAKRAQN